MSVPGAELVVLREDARAVSGMLDGLRSGDRPCLPATASREAREANALLVQPLPACDERPHPTGGDGDSGDWARSQLPHSTDLLCPSGGSPAPMGPVTDPAHVEALRAEARDLRVRGAYLDAQASNYHDVGGPRRGRRGRSCRVRGHHDRAGRNRRSGRGLPARPHR